MTSQYFFRPSFTVAKIVVNNFDKKENFAELAMKRYLYGSLCNFGIQYKVLVSTSLLSVSSFCKQL